MHSDGPMPLAVSRHPRPSSGLAALRFSALPDVWRGRAWWILVVWTVVFWRLGYLSLLDPDEAHYAEMTREMMRSRHWLVPLLDGAPFIDKPVLFHWLQGLSVLLLGESEFAVRLPSALAAVGLIAFVRWAGVALLGAPTGRWGGLLFATIPLTFMLANIALFDMVFALFLFGALACLLVSSGRQTRRLEAAGYIMLTLAVMVKGPVALILVAGFIVLAHGLGADTRTRMRWLRWKTGLVLVLLAASPWFVWMYLNFHHRFVQEYFLAGNLYYLTQPQSFSRRAVSSTFFLRTFAAGFFPCSFVVVGRGIDILRRRLVPTVEERLLWLWMITVIAFFSIARFKLDHYIFPAAPACALIAALAWRESAGDAARATPATRVMIAAAAVVLILTGSLGGAYLFNIDLELPPTAALLPASLVLGGIALLARRRGSPWAVPATPAAMVLSLAAAYGFVVLIGFPTMERVRPMAAIGRILSARALPEGEIATYRLERWRGSLRYYAHRPVRGLENRGELEALLNDGKAAYVVMLRTDYEDLRASGVAIEPLLRRRAVIKTTGKGLRRQHWDYLVVATNEPRRLGTGPGK